MPVIRDGHVGMRDQFFLGVASLPILVAGHAKKSVDKHGQQGDAGNRQQYQVTMNVHVPPSRLGFFAI
jgi:hypothetical protein